MSTTYHACSFKPGQHRSEAWQVPRGHRMVHVKYADKVHAIAVPATRKTGAKKTALHLKIDAYFEAHKVDGGRRKADSASIIDPDLIDIIK